MRLNDAVEHFLLDLEVRGKTKPTLIDYRHRLGVIVWLLQEVCQVAELEEVKVVHLRQVVQHLLTAKHEYQHGRRCEGETFAPSTVRSFVRILKSFFNWCYQEELIEHSPVARLAPVKIPVRVRPAFTPEHISRMLATCDTSTPIGFRNYVILLLLLDTGMRIGEICNLKVSDIHDRFVKVYGKGRREREIGVHPEVGKLLWKYTHKYRHPVEPDEQALFIGRTGTPLHVIGVHLILKHVQQESGLSDVKLSAHVFRHTFANWYLQNGGDLFNLSREMGHSDVQVTRLYLEDYSSKEARKNHATFSPIVDIELKKKRKVQKKQQ